MTGTGLFVALTLFFAAGILCGGLAGASALYRVYERDGGRMDRTYEEGYDDALAEMAPNVKAWKEAGGPLRETVLVGTVLPPERPGETTLERIEPVISSRGYHLVKDEPEPLYVPDTWLRDELAKTEEWSRRELAKQIRWRNRLPEWRPEGISA